MKINMIHTIASQEILQLYVNTFNAEPWNEKWTLETANMRINDYLKNPMAMAYEGQLDGKCVGFLMGYSTSFLGMREFYIEDFVITTELQRMGLGTEMLSFVQKDLSNRGINSITLLTEKELPSEKFYHKNLFLP